MLLGSCTYKGRMEQLTVDSAAAFKLCEEQATNQYPIKRVKVAEETELAPICRYDPALGQITCSEGLVQKQTEHDSNEQGRKAYMTECLRLKFK